MQILSGPATVKTLMSSQITSLSIATFILRAMECVDC